MPVEGEAWAQAWLRKESLDTLNRRIHGTDPVERWYQRACYIHESAIALWPFAVPKRGARVLDVGSGVGWLMQAALDLFPESHVTGLDISPPMLQQAEARLGALPPGAGYQGRYELRHYDGLTFPFEDEVFDYIYCYRTLWHIPEHFLFPLLKEMARVLRPGCPAVMHFLPYHAATVDFVSGECAKQRAQKDDHYLYFYTPQKIYWWICQVLGCSNFDIQQFEKRLYVHFSKGGATQVINPELARAFVRLHELVAVD